MKKTGLALSLCLSASLVLVAGAQTPLKHIRVIVDTSASLQDNDPSGFVKLSTVLFYDLALKELGPNDSFKVIHFPDGKSPSWPGTPTPPLTIDDQFSKELKRSSLDVSQFHLWVRNLPYTSPSTYFSSGIRWALTDLERSSNSKDNRVVVLITDGKPDFPKEDGEQLKILADSLKQENIQLFVLAFGPQNENANELNGLFGLGASGGLKGKVFAGARNDHLLDDMLEIFCESFGFSKDRIENLQSFPASKIELDVTRGATLESAAVVASYREPGQPRFQLDSPPGQSVGTSEVKTDGAKADPSAQRKNKRGPELSYAFQWLEPPAKGFYHFETNGAMPQEIAILRPIRVQSAIRSSNGYSTNAAMAGKRTPMEVLVFPANGSSGDPGPNLQVCFHLKYLSQNDSRDPTCYEGTSTASTAEGHVFTINPTFIDNPDGRPRDTEYYQAYIEVEVSQNNTVVYRDLPHPIAVYPAKSIQVTPRTV